MKLPTISYSLFLLFIPILARVTWANDRSTSTSTPSSDTSANNNEQPANERPASVVPSAPPPTPIASASYLSLDGLTLVVVFDRPVNLSDSIETIERRKAMEASEHLAKGTVYLDEPLSSQAGNEDIAQGESLSTAYQQTCQDLKKISSSPQHAAQTQYLVQSIQLCAKLLSKRTLKLLHKYRLHNCIWPSRVQFLIKLSKPISTIAPDNNSLSPVKITFRKGVLSEHNQPDGLSNEQEINIELNKLPLESLGVPLSPRLALTGPNQVPPCGQFSLTAHLSSPYGLVAGESLKMSWSVEKVVSIIQPTINSTLSSVAKQLDAQQAEVKWQTLRQLVQSNKGNNLVLDAQLLQFIPQLYEFYVSATFTTSLTTVTLNATHQVSKLDYETPIGTIYGSHILAQQQQQLNPHNQVMMIADIQVPECANNIKQVGVYWQVSDSRVLFEQTYAPYYLAKQDSLPEQASIEFRLNLFYGLRVKRSASAGTLVQTGDTILDSQISNGLLILTIGQESTENNNQLELFAAASSNDLKDNDKYSYLWSCFDGKTAQPCFKSLKVITQTNNTTSYDVSSSISKPTSSEQTASSGVLLIDQYRQTQPVLRIPLSWIDPDAQLWFGLQRFDKSAPIKQPQQQQQQQSQQQQTEYALVTIQPGQAPVVSIGPVLIGRSKQRATIRNPLTGAIVLVENVPVVIIGRLGSPGSIQSFAWHSSNYIQPLYWTSRNITNSLSGHEELVTELHLNPNLLVAYAHFQVQLTACTESGFASASLNLDVVQSVSNCRVEASQNVVTNSLVVSVDYCNIPLGLSPITYQLYIADTSSSDGFIDTYNSNNNNNGARQSSEEDDYMNETDETYLEGLAQPMTVPQLSPVFSFTGLNLQSLIAISDAQINNGNSSTADIGRADSESRQQAARVRFVARVCNRLQSCRMFYSQPVSQRSLLNQLTNITANNKTQSSLLGVPGINVSGLQNTDRLQVAQSVIQSMQNMIASSKRANLAGNSIAAVSLLNGVINLGQKLITTMPSSNLIGPTSGLASQAINSQVVSNNINNNNRHDRINLNKIRVRELLQVAVRDCLNYSVLSLQRQFHYTDSGQTNLMTHSMSRILSLPTSSIEFKFKAMRLMAQLTKRSIAEQVNLKLDCLADLKTLQSGYEALFGTFSHYSIDSSSDKSSSTNSNSVGEGGGNNIGPSILLNTLSIAVSNSSLRVSEQSQSQSQPQQQQSRQLNNNSNNGTTTTTTSVSKKKREEAILTYLKSIRLAYRALLSSAAIQLPLGDSQQFQYGDQNNQIGIRKNNENGNTIDPGEDRVSTVRSRLDRSEKDGSDRTVLSSSNSPLTATTTSSDIVSSLTHLTELPITISTQPETSTSTISNEQQSAAANDSSSNLYVDLHEFGSISLTFDRRFLTQFNSRLSGRQLRCRNDTTTKCSTFVLSITSFAGKAPFRSLDLTQSLKVPVLEVSLLSPIDGSNLLDLITDNGNSNDEDDQFRRELREDYFKTIITFTIPEIIEPAGLSGRSLETPFSSSSSTSSSFPSSTSSSSSPPHSQRRRYKCYQFDENKNEWIRSSLSEKQQQAEDVLFTNTNNLDQQESAPLVVAAERRIRCTFNGLGTFSAFQGRPPSPEAVMNSPVVIALSVVLALVALFSVLACFASFFSSPSASASSSSSTSSDSESQRRRRSKTGRRSTSEQHDDSRKLEQDHDHASLEQVRHPEKNATYRNNFGNYPGI